tara:strand:- start:8636 stop:9523 length:888 start_codon:yes stop_codon:yes gene_type:complete
MWFKNLAIYQFTGQVVHKAETLDKHLREALFQPCARLAPMSQGWHAPIGENEDAPLAHETSNCSLLCLRKEEKIIPPAALKEQVQNAVDKFEREDGRKPGRNEKQRMRDDVYFSMLPQAFTKSTYTYAYIDADLKCLIIDSPNANKAEEFCSFLRNSLGSLKVEPLDNTHVKEQLTSWINGGDLPENFGVLDNAVLDMNNEENGKVRYQHHDLFGDDVKLQLKDGAQASQLAMSYLGQITFSLQYDYIFKQLKFLDVIKEQAEEAFAETPEQRFDTDFTIMASSVREMLKGLLPN